MIVLGALIAAWPWAAQTLWSTVPCWAWCWWIALAGSGGRDHGAMMTFAIGALTRAATAGSGGFPGRARHPGGEDFASGEMLHQSGAALVAMAWSTVRDRPGRWPVVLALAAAGALGLLSASAARWWWLQG
jgi:hypothetical protein